MSGEAFHDYIIFPADAGGDHFQQSCVCTVSRNVFRTGGYHLRHQCAGHGTERYRSADLFQSVISLLRSFIPKQVRIAGYIIVISGFVTAVELIIKAYLPALDKSLGLFIPLIVVNCIILARAEAFASKNKVIPSVIDGLASGIGYTLAVTAVAFVRELLGTGVLFAAADGTGGLQILGDWYSPATIFIMPAGAFFTLGVLCAVFNTARRAAAKRSEKKSKPKTEAEIPAETEAAV